MRSATIGRMAETVLVGVDGSESCARAVAFAAREVQDTPARVVVAHVVPWSPYAWHTAEENERRHVEKEREIAAATTQIVEPALAALRAEGVEAEGLVRHGHPAETLCELAGDLAARQVVVGRRGHSRVRELLFGSTTGNVVQIARVPVTVVP